MRESNAQRAQSAPNRDAASYALGVVTFEMLAGQPPFDGDGTALMYRIVHEPPRRVTTLNAAGSAATQRSAK